MYLKDELVLSKLDGVLLSDLVILRDIWWKKAPKMLQKTQTWIRRNRNRNRVGLLALLELAEIVGFVLQFALKISYSRA